MSMEEKYGNFSIKKMVFYDDIEKAHFLDVFGKTYKNYISKINGKKVIGHGKLKRLTPEEKQYLRFLNMQVQVDDERNVVEIVGYGHRRIIMPLEMFIRQLFDEGRIVTYEANDNLNRSFDVPHEQVYEEIEAFLDEKNRRMKLFLEGELEEPAYRNEEKHSKK